MSPALSSFIPEMGFPVCEMIVEVPNRGEAEGECEMRKAKALA